MEYTIFLTQQPNAPWRAVVHELPDCTVEAPTRAEALERIQQRITSIARSTEVVRIPVAVLPKNVQETPLFTQTPWHWFGISQDNAIASALYDEIEQQRERHLIGE